MNREQSLCVIRVTLLYQGGGEIQGSVGDFQERSLFTQDESVGLREAEVGARFRVLPQSCAVDLVRDLEQTMLLRRRFAYPCLDWSERQPHVAGALGSAMLKLVLKKKWLTQDGDRRVLRLTGAGRRELKARLGLVL